MRYNIYEYQEKVAEEIKRLALQRNDHNERVKDALEQVTGKFDERECEDFVSIVQAAAHCDKMYAHYSTKAGVLKAQIEELQQAERVRDSAYSKYVERVRLHFRTTGGMQATTDLQNYYNSLKTAVENVKALSFIEVEDCYAL